MLPYSIGKVLCYPTPLEQFDVTLLPWNSLMLPYSHGSVLCYSTHLDQFIVTLLLWISLMLPYSLGSVLCYPTPLDQFYGTLLSWISFMLPYSLGSVLCYPTPLDQFLCYPSPLDQFNSTVPFVFPLGSPLIHTCPGHGGNPAPLTWRVSFACWWGQGVLELGHGRGSVDHDTLQQVHDHPANNNDIVNLDYGH